MQGNTAYEHTVAWEDIHGRAWGIRMSIHGKHIHMSTVHHGGCLACRYIIHRSILHGEVYAGVQNGGYSSCTGVRGHAWWIWGPIWW